MEFESKLIPILRDGVDVIKMILFKQLKTYLARKYPGKETACISKLSGAIINDLFCIDTSEEPFATFKKENISMIRKETKNIATEFEEMRIPLTDALRVQFLCDSLEGIDNPLILKYAKELGILLADREIPLPKHFMELVRALGRKFNILHETGTA
ncbi:MAG: hypothetical protein GY749_44895 [Desulfobacteraceae bacterium]|nr:hypothetical protein [Desulfobacteraceae bacterium]